MVVFDPIGVWEAFTKQVRIADVRDLTPVADISIEEERGSVGSFDRPSANPEIREIMLTTPDVMEQLQDLFFVRIQPDVIFVDQAFGEKAQRLLELRHALAGYERNQFIA
jgi:hypothetical protein